MSNKRFEGFERPEQNWSKLPHDLIKSLPDVETVGELKVILYILRHTWGFQEYGLSKKITVDEFMNGRKRKDGTRMDNGVGVSHPTVIDGLQRAVEHGFITVEVDDSDLGRVKKYYAIRMKGSKDFTPDSRSSEIKVENSLPRTEKETSERNPGKTVSSQRSENPTGEAALDAYGLGKAYREQFPERPDESKLPHGDGVWRSWCADEVRPRPGVSVEAIQRVGYALEEMGLTPPRGIKSRMKGWVSGCAELYQGTDGDLDAVRRAYKYALENGLTITTPQSLFNLARTAQGKKLKGDSGSSGPLTLDEIEAWEASQREAR